MTGKRHPAWTWAAAAALAAPCLLLPAYNPDLFWHLSSGRWIWQNHAVPRVDFLSFTAAGAAWSDFEWLSQALYYAVHRLGGLTALWGLKVLLLLACARLVDRLLRLHGLPRFFRAAAVVVWSAGMLPHSDIRPELSSLLLFLSMLLLLEKQRLGRLKASWGPSIGSFLLFAAAANLHAGFIFALMLPAFYALGELLAGRRWPRPPVLWGLAGLAGTFCNPYGWGPYVVMFDHLRQRAALSFIQEWQPMTMTNRFHWPFWAILAAFLFILHRLRRRPQLPVALLLASLYFAFSAVAHARMGAFFFACAVPTGFLLADMAGWLVAAPAAKRACAACALAYGVFLSATLPRLERGVFDHRLVPRQAAEFMAEESGALLGLRLYSPWEWGGYLGWRLAPWYRVFWDGRYIFHDRLPEAARASRDASSWQEYMDDQGLSGALLNNLELRFSTQKAYPDGSRKEFLRPWYRAYMPSQRWALVYWDPQVLLFVARRAVPASWLAAHEYRYVRPKDEAAFEEALRLGEIPKAAVAEEERRHLRETR
ncbi:MAG: hypothetical protein AAB320_04750 [Elusimicrobiota bacterium]